MTDYTKVLRVFWTSNHKSNDLLSGTFADMLALPERPATLKDKAAAHEWSLDRETRHCYYSTYEPKDPTQKLSAKERNPARWMHGVVVDYDCALEFDDGLVAGGRKTALSLPTGFVPLAMSRTFSGGIRMVWAFEKAVPVFTDGVASYVLEKFRKAAKIAKLFPGFDEKAYEAIEQRYERGHGWEILNAYSAVPENILVGWTAEAMKAEKFEKANVPWEKIAAEVERRWPGCWKGDFLPERRGGHFWEQEIDGDHTILHEAGAYSHKAGQFFTWAELLGASWVRQQQTDRIGGAIKNIYRVSKGYYRRTERGWVDCNQDDITRHLKVVHGISSKSTGGGASEVEHVLEHIFEVNRAAGLRPTPYDPRDIVEGRGGRYLNTATVKVIPPVNERVAWDHPGLDPIRFLFDEGFGEHGQDEVLKSWLHLLYRSALDGDLRPGHAMFIAGEEQCGKTCFLRQIVDPLMGGSEVATDYIQGTEKFNSPLFGVGVWTIDDAKALASEAAHRTYTTTVKAVVASSAMSCRAMYCEPITVQWKGRLIVLTNIDANSSKMLPDTESSNLDKMIFLYMKRPRTPFPPVAWFNTAARGALPYLAAYLRDYQIPERLLGDNRFGFRAFHHPELIAVARATQASSAFLEVIQNAAVQFLTENKNRKEWVVTPTALIGILANTGSLKEVVARNYSNNSYVGKLLLQLNSRPDSGVKLDKKSSSQYYRFDLEHLAKGAPSLNAESLEACLATA